VELMPRRLLRRFRFLFRAFTHDLTARSISQNNTDADTKITATNSAIISSEAAQRNDCITSPQRFLI
jgi:hypothetical protein